MAFATLACNSFGQQAPEMLNLPMDSGRSSCTRGSVITLPAAAYLPGVVDENSSQLKLYQRRRRRCYRQLIQEVSVAILEGVCERSTERAFGGAFALRSYPEYIEVFRPYAVPWSPDFLHAPHDPGSSSGPPQDVGPSSRTLV